MRKIGSRTSNVKRFFSHFCDFGLNLGGPGSSKNRKKSEKIVFGTLSKRAPNFSWIWGTVLEQYLEIWDKLRMDFKKLWGRFLQLFGRIWKTKQWLGRPRESQVDLIIWVAILVVQKIWGPLTSDEAGVSSIASRNRLRLTSLSGRFGRFWETKIDAQIRF